MPARIVLTGSSGNLGSYLLASLIECHKVDRIWCLNRSNNVDERQAQLLSDRGLDADIPKWVEYHQMNVAEQGLGLPQHVYGEMVEQATHVLHAAWPVDWNRAFASFETSIRGVAHIITLTSQCRQSPCLFYVSSVAAAGNWGAIPGARKTVPEDELDDWKVARMGYGQSKLVAERLLAEEARRCGIKVAICRVGQVAGPIEHGLHGFWPRQEWFPSLIISSRYLGMLPESLGPGEDVDWVPVDQLSAIMTELLLSELQPGKAQFYHITNPNTVSWRSLLPEVKKVLDVADTIKIVDLQSWVTALERSAQEDELDATLNPAAKLLTFFQNLSDKAVHLPKARAAKLEVKKTQIYSPTLRGLRPIGDQDMSLWMKQWENV